MPRGRGAGRAVGWWRAGARLSVALCLMSGLTSGAGNALAAPSESRSGTSRKAPRARAATPKPNKPSAPKRARERAPAPPIAPAAPVTAQVELEAAPAPAHTAAEARVEVAATSHDAAVVKTVEAAAGVKTYTFGAQEVEGRLRSPQILYFLRRVRAEFDPQPLGHRSFMLELSDTRRQPALE